MASVNWDRTENVEACMLVVTGDEHAGQDACAYCQGGRGVIAGCFTLGDLSQGSCANCHYNGMGSKCSFRKSEVVPYPSKYSLLVRAYIRNWPLTTR